MIWVSQKQPPEVFCEKRCSLEISENSQENTVARASFLIKLQAQACNFIKKETLGTGVFLWILRNFQEYISYKTPLDDCFWLVTTL